MIPRPIQRRINHLFRSRGPARLWDLYDSGKSWSTNAEAMLAAVLPGEPTAQYFEEFARWRDPLQLDPGTHPGFYDVGQQTAAALYAIVRATKPGVMVETGVANGASTRVLIEAISQNKTGRLFSIDIAPGLDTRWDGKGVWTYRQTNGSIAALAGLLSELGTIDLFLHDSDHSYRHQFGEYTTALPHLRPGGLLLSDDADWSNALLDVREREHLELHCLMDVRKVFAASRRDAS